MSHQDDTTCVTRHMSSATIAENVVSVTDDVLAMLRLRERCIVAIGVSGGKDSCAVAIATIKYLRSIDFAGTIVLIHADLGKVEWKQSLPKCEELAKRLGVELIVVRRKAGGMLERWQGRWLANVERWENLECVKLILPWSTPSMRFCTSELKVAPICGELKKRFNGHAIINVMGIRRQESTDRAKKPVSVVNSKLLHKTVNAETGMRTSGLDWNPIIEWSVEQVFDEIASIGMLPHVAYTDYGMSRVSCMFCILSNSADLLSAATAAESHGLYREMVDLEIESTFAFQGAKWLGDVKPDLLTEEQRDRLVQSKLLAIKRREIEDRIPPELHYVSGWPTFVPDIASGQIIADVRQELGSLLSLHPKYTTGDEVCQRYEQLMSLKKK